MADEGPRYVEGALVCGEAAVVLEQVLSSRPVAAMLAAMADRHPHLRGELVAMRRAVRAAAMEQAVRRAGSVGGSVDGSAETPDAWGEPVSGHEIDTREAGALLGLGERQVRNLAAGGLGRKVAGRWLLDGALVMAYLEQRRTA